MEPLHEKIRTMPWYIRGIIYTIVIFTIEYISGWMLESFLGRCPWDYSSSTAYHINGYIRLDYAPAWFGLGLLFEKVHDFLDEINL